MRLSVRTRPASNAPTLSTQRVGGHARTACSNLSPVHVVAGLVKVAAADFSQPHAFNMDMEFSTPCLALVASDKRELP